MTELLSLVRKLQDIEDRLQSDREKLGDSAACAFAKMAIQGLRKDTQSEIDRCEAAYAKELRETEEDIANRADASGYRPVYADGKWPGVR